MPKITIHDRPSCDYQPEGSDPSQSLCPYHKSTTENPLLKIYEKKQRYLINTAYKNVSNAVSSFLTSLPQRGMPTSSHLEKFGENFTISYEFIKNRAELPHCCMVNDVDFAHQFATFRLEQVNLPSHPPHKVFYVESEVQNTYRKLSEQVESCKD